jgi:proteasome lid subunit RPN8/RPN11
MFRLSKKQVDELINHARECVPREACGILAGKGDKVEKVYKMTNTSEEPENCYFMDPREQLNVMKEIRQQELDLVGIYHSHPASEARPSARDIELAFYQDAAYLIISLKDRENPGCRAFKLKDKNIEEIKLSIVS